MDKIEVQKKCDSLSVWSSLHSEPVQLSAPQVNN